VKPRAGPRCGSFVLEVGGKGDLARVARCTRRHGHAGRHQRAELAGLVGLVRADGRSSWASCGLSVEVTWK